MGLGFSAMIGGITPCVLPSFTGAPTPGFEDHGVTGYFYSVMPFGMAVMFLAISPTDTKAISVVCCFFLLFVLAMASTMTGSLQEEWAPATPEQERRSTPMGRFFISVFFVALALLLARDLASTTSRCDLLRAHLNRADIKHGAEHHQKIDWLFVTLQRLASPSPRA